MPATILSAVSLTMPSVRINSLGLRKRAISSGIVPLPDPEVSETARGCVPTRMLTVTLRASPPAAQAAWMARVPVEVSV